MILRWRGQINVWESLYIFPASLAVGLFNSSQFMGPSTTVKKGYLATNISIFFLSQQIGMMIGAGASSALLRSTFRDASVKQLGDGVASSQVSSPKDSNSAGTVKDCRLSHWQFLAVAKKLLTTHADWL